VKYGNERSRIDLLLSGPSSVDCYVEVKSVTLLEMPAYKGIGYFPDAVTERGTRHLRELSNIKKAGQRAVLCFCVQHSGISEVRPAKHVDPDYAAQIQKSMQEGVEVLAYKVRMSPRGLHISRSLPVRLTDE
jgi:sugar fermentation stimulation protein A